MSHPKWRVWLLGLFALAVTAVFVTAGVRARQRWSENQSQAEAYAQKQRQLLDLADKNERFAALIRRIASEESIRDDDRALARSLGTDGTEMLKFADQTRETLAEMRKLYDAMKQSGNYTNDQMKAFEQQLKDPFSGIRDVAVNHESDATALRKDALVCEQKKRDCEQRWW
jgi:hypothetical protein